MRQLRLRRCKRHKGDNDTSPAPDCVASPHPSFDFSHPKASAWIRSSGGGKRCNTEMSRLNYFFKLHTANCKYLHTSHYLTNTGHYIHLIYSMLHNSHFQLYTRSTLHTLNNAHTPQCTHCSLKTEHYSVHKYASNAAHFSRKIYD